MNESALILYGTGRPVSRPFWFWRCRNVGQGQGKPPWMVVPHVLPGGGTRLVELFGGGPLTTLGEVGDYIDLNGTVSASSSRRRRDFSRGFLALLRRGPHRCRPSVASSMEAGGSRAGRPEKRGKKLGGKRDIFCRRCFSLLFLPGAGAL